jgi:hypothetical protein
MHYSQDFFALNLDFAAKAAEVTGLSFAESLLEYTHLYLSFGLGRDFNPADESWRGYLMGLPGATAPAAWTYRFYLARQAAAAPPAALPTFGCFSYAVWEGGRVRLHFHAEEEGALAGAAGPLSKEQMPARLAELRALFVHVGGNAPDAQFVVGGSWLYNVEAYRRLFPPSHLATANFEDPEFQFVGLWGQFLDRHGQVRAAMADEFRARLGRAVTVEALTDCFPYRVLRLKSDIRAFYVYYDVGSGR